MKVVFQIPDSLFVSPTIITGLDQSGDYITVKGEPINVSNPVNTGWLSDHFGFIHSDVESYTVLERIHDILKMVWFAQKSRERLEFLVYVSDSGMVNIYWREQKNNF